MEWKEPFYIPGIAESGLTLTKEQISYLMNRFRDDFKKDEIDYVRFLNHMHINQNDRNSERKIRMEFNRIEKEGSDIDKLFKRIPEKV